MESLFEELVARLRWQPECIDGLRTELHRHPDVAERLRAALPVRPPEDRRSGPGLEPLDAWLQH